MRHAKGSRQQKVVWIQCVVVIFFFFFWEVIPHGVITLSENESDNYSRSRSVWLHHYPCTEYCGHSQSAWTISFFCTHVLSSRTMSQNPPTPRNAPLKITYTTVVFGTTVTHLTFFVLVIFFFFFQSLDLASSTDESTPPPAAKTKSGTKVQTGITCRAPLIVGTRPAHPVDSQQCRQNLHLMRVLTVNKGRKQCLVTTIRLTTKATSEWYGGGWFTRRN